MEQCTETAAELFEAEGVHVTGPGDAQLRRLYWESVGDQKTFSKKARLTDKQRSSNMSQLFAKIDLDHSKSISFREFRQYIRTIEKNSSGKLTPLNDAELNHIWADFDTNNDKEISVAEFKTKLNEYAPVRVFRHWVRGVKSGKEISIRKRGIPPSMLTALEADLAQVEQNFLNQFAAK